MNLKNGGVGVECAIDVLDRIIENNTTNGLPYVEPKLTEEDAKNRRLVMVRDSDEYAEHGPQKLVAIEGDYFITSKVDGRGAASWRQCRPATKEEIKAAGLLTPEEIAKAKRLEDMVNAKWLGGGGMSDQVKSNANAMALDVSLEKARALHRVWRALNDGDCPNCHAYHQATEMLRRWNVSQKGIMCPSCSFCVTTEEIQAIEKLFAPAMEAAVKIFQDWRADNKPATTPEEVAKSEWRELAG